MTAAKKHHTKLKSLILFFMVLVFLFAIVWSLFKYYDVWFGRVQYGFRVQPPFSISVFKLSISQGHRSRPLSVRRDTQGRWWLLYFHPGVCHRLCRKTLKNLRHIHQALDQQRIRRALLTYPDLANNIGINMMLERGNKGTRHFTVSQRLLRRVIEKRVMVSYSLMPGTLYVVDPRGYVVLCFKPRERSSRVYHDLKLLLRQSEIG